MDFTSHFIIYVAAILPVVTPKCPATQTCIDVLNRLVEESTSETICGLMPSYRKCIQAAEISCDVKETSNEIYGMFPMCRTKRSEQCPQLTECYQQFENKTSDRCKDSKILEYCLRSLVTSCDLQENDLEPAITAVAQHCTGSQSMLVAADGIDSLGDFLKTILNPKRQFFSSDDSTCPELRQCVNKSSAFHLASQRKIFAQVCSSLKRTQTCLDQSMRNCKSRDPFSETLLEIARSEMETVCTTRAGCANLSVCSSLLLETVLSYKSIIRTCRLVKQVHACLVSAKPVCPSIPGISVFRIQVVTSHCDAGLYTTTTSDDTSAVVTNVDVTLVAVFKKLFDLLDSDAVSGTCSNLMSCVPQRYDYVRDLVDRKLDQFCFSMGKMHYCMSVVASFCEGISSELHTAMRQSRHYLFESCKTIGAAVAATSDGFLLKHSLRFTVIILGCVNYLH